MFNPKEKENNLLKEYARPLPECWALVTDLTAGSSLSEEKLTAGHHRERKEEAAWVPSCPQPLIAGVLQFFPGSEVQLGSWLSEDTIYGHSLIKMWIPSSHTASPSLWSCFFLRAHLELFPFHVCWTVTTFRIFWGFCAKSKLSAIFPMSPSKEANIF